MKGTVTVREVAGPVSRSTAQTPRHWYERKSYRAIAVALLGAVFAMGCNDDEVIAPIKVRSVVVAPAASFIEVGESVQLTANAVTVGRTSPNVTWLSSAPNVATVTANGEVVGVAEGTAVISAKSVADPSKIGVASVTVTEGDVRSVLIEPNPANVIRGTTLQLKVIAKNGSEAEVVGRPALWVSADPQIATVSSTGMVTALAFGTTEVRATIGDIMGRAVLNVGVGAVEKVIVPAAVTIELGESLDLEAKPMDAIGNVVSQADVFWLSENPAIVSVSEDGTITGLALGTALVKARAQNAEANIAVTVVAPPTATLTIAPRPTELRQAETVQLSAQVLDGNGAPMALPITWTSSAPAIATVSGGLVTGVAAAATPVKIIASATFAAGKVAADTLTLTILPSEVWSVQATVPKATIEVGETLIGGAAFYNRVGDVIYGYTAAWSSDKPGIASVTADGKITGVAEGSATLTAECNGASGKVLIHVVRAEIGSMAIKPAALGLFVGQIGNLTLELRDRRGALIIGRTVVWGTADKFIAAVNGSGAVTGTGPGNTTVTATVDGKSASAAIVVQYSTSAVDHVIVQVADAEIQVAAKTTAIAILQDALGYTLHGRAVIWSTSNPTVATVDATGKVTGVGTGTVMVRATSEGKYGEAPLVVVAAPWVPGEQQPLVDPSRGAWEIGPYGRDEVMAQSFKPTADQWLGYIAFPVYCTDGVKLSVVIKEGSFFGPVLWSGQMAGLPKTRTGQFIQIQILNPSTMPNGIRLKANTSYYVELAAVRPHGVWSNCGISKGPRSDTYARGSGYWQQPSPWFHPLPFGEDLPFITYVR